MTNLNPKSLKVVQVIKLLEFLLTIDDVEVIQSTLESIIEILQEENK